MQPLDVIRIGAPSGSVVRDAVDGGKTAFLFTDEPPRTAEIPARY